MTPLIERVEPNSVAAAGDRLLVHFSSSKITACALDTQTATTSFEVPAEEQEQVERERENFPETRQLENVSLKPCLISETSGSGE